MRARRALVAALAGGAVLASCSSAQITQDALQQSLTTVFANLYVHQLALLGRPGLLPAQAQVITSCGRMGAAGGPHAQGPGDDWRCTVVWLAEGMPMRATYDLQVRPTGCYTADGPAGVIGPQELQAPDGTTFVNPLAAIDGCLDLS